jgi:hypothetical protein
MRKITVRVMSALLLSLAATTFALAAEPKGDRILAIGVNEGPGADYASSFDVARAAGAQAVELALNWDDIEVEPGVYRPNPNWLAIAANYYPAYGTRIALGINAVDTVTDRRPAWLKSKRWDDPEVVESYKRLCVWILNNSGSLDLLSLALGNEVDALLGDSTEDWKAYINLATATAVEVKARRSQLVSGVKTTFAALAGPQSDSVRALHRAMDAAMLTYYPLASDFIAKPPQFVAGDFAFAAGALPGKPIYFAEIGYPASEMCGSSPALQAEFVRQAFAAWDRHAVQIGFLNFVWLNDIGDAELKEYVTYYGVDASCFAEFLGTLGLRRDGAAKPAFEALAGEARKRGW